MLTAWMLLQFFLEAQAAHKLPLYFDLQASQASAT